jgi:nitronate monooxygenase
MTAHDREIPPYPIQNWLTQPIRKAAAQAGRIDLLALWAGQNAPLVRLTKAADLVAFLLDDTDRVFAGLSQRFR